MRFIAAVAIVFAAIVFVFLYAGCGDDYVKQTSPNTWYINRSGEPPEDRIDETCPSVGQAVKEIRQGRGKYDLIVICEVP